MAMSFTSWDKDSNYLAHFGTKGMKWGVRRFQNADGTLTSLGKDRYGKEGYRSSRGMTRDIRKMTKEAGASRHYGDSLTKKYRTDRLKIAEAAAKRKGDTDKAEKLRRKIDKVKASVSDKKKAKASAYYKNADKAEKMANRIIDEAKKNGYKVSAKNTYRTYYTGKQKAAQLLSAASAYGTARFMAEHAPIRLGDRNYGFAPVVNTGTLLPYKKYTVRKRR